VSGNTFFLTVKSRLGVGDCPFALLHGSATAC